MQQSRAVKAGVSAVLFAVVASCGGGNPIKTGGKAQGSLAGVVFKGAVTNGTVRAFKLSDTFERGEKLADATTDDNGAFTLSLPPYSGALVIVASTGSYIEEAIGLGVKLDGNELTALVPAYTGGAVITGIRVTPVSTLATALALVHARAGGKLAAAHEEAKQHLHQHFGGVDWSTVSPADLSVAGVTNLSPEARAGLVLSGLSWLAKQQAETSNLQPGLVVNAATLTSLLVQDAADGTFDGSVSGAQLKSGQVPLTNLTLRSELVQGMTGFINSTRNASALSLSDITGFLAAVGTNNDPYLFCPGQVASASCASGPIDTEPPVLAFVRPANGAGVAGSTIVEVHASDNSKLGTLRFTAPTSLTGTGVVWANEQRDGSLTATLDVSALPDGPLEIRAETTDAAGNPAAKSITIIVSNQGPELTVTAPSTGLTVQGTGAAISATATARAPGATIQRIEVVSPLDGGVGSDILPAADSFAAIWNTTVMPEGPAVVTLRATDSYGTSTDVSVSVVVDNVPFGTVSGSVIAGAPVNGLSVKLLAIDDTTGLPVTGRLGGPILGQTSEVTVDGGFSFTLTQENYSGPVQLVAEGTGAASYLDPSDSTANVILPGTMKLSSFVSTYTTGQQLSRPVTYWTTLADGAALAFAGGRNPTSPAPSSLTAALSTIDPLFARHIVTSSSWDSRLVFPTSLTSSPQSLGDVVFAAAPDVALNQLARQIATDVGLTPATGFSAAHLVALLQSDISDGQFDGKANGAQLSTAGTTPYSLTADTTRFRQAIALDLFIRSTNNLSGLSRQDMQTSNIYDTISMDTSLLYPASATPTPFDNQSPTVTWTITYQRDSSTVAPAVGAAQLVRALTFVSADSHDGSGVDSMVITLDGVQLGGNPGSNADHFAGNFDTVAWPLADGVHVLNAHVCDRLTNCGDVATTFTVDNTVPVIGIVSPALNRGGGLGGSTPKYFSQAFQVEASATDTNGVGSLVVTAPTVGADTDMTPEHLLVYASSWNLGAAVDGLTAVQFSSCDVVGNCSTASRAYNVDRTPPTVTAGSGLAYTNQSTTTVVVNATDTGAGVKDRWVQLGTNAPVLAVPTNVLGSTLYVATIDLNGLQGALQFKVWATDAAEPSNSGESAGSPYSVVVTKTRDTTAPVVSALAPTSYRDERGLTVAKDAQGRPVMPAQYQYAGAPVAVGENGRIYKLNSKMVATDPNEAFLRWAVTTPTTYEAPISAATYRVTFAPAADGSNACASIVCPSGQLRLSAATAPNFTLYELPLNNATMVLNAVNTFEVTFKDAALNTTTRTFTVEHTAVGAPIVLWRDTQYPTYTDTNNFFTKSYGALFGHNYRVIRWVVYNPNVEPVTFITDNTWSVPWTETFTATTSRLGSNGFGGWNANTQISDGNRLTSRAQSILYTHRVADICTPPGGSTQTCNQSGACMPQASSCPMFSGGTGNALNDFCPGTDFTHPQMINGQYAEPIHWLGTDANPTTVFDCNLVSGTPQSLRYSPTYNVDGVALIEGYSNPAAQGGETSPAPMSNGGFVIPAATSATAGAIALYSDLYADYRPATGVPAVDLPTVGPFQVAFFYKLQTLKYTAGATCQWYCGAPYNGYFNSYADEYWLYGLYWQLNTPTIPYAGNLSVKTRAAAVQPVPLTVSSLDSVWPSVPFSK